MSEWFFQQSAMNLNARGPVAGRATFLYLRHYYAHVGRSCLDDCSLRSNPHSYPALNTFFHLIARVSGAIATGPPLAVRRRRILSASAKTSSSITSLALKKEQKKPPWGKSYFPVTRNALSRPWTWFTKPIALIFNGRFLLIFWYVNLKIVIEEIIYEKLNYYVMFLQAKHRTHVRVQAVGTVECNRATAL